jgi:hypothetical protein
VVNKICEIIHSTFTDCCAGALFSSKNYENTLKAYLLFLEFGPGLDLEGHDTAFKHPNTYIQGGQKRDWLK